MSDNKPSESVKITRREDPQHRTDREMNDAIDRERAKRTNTPK